MQIQSVGYATQNPQFKANNNPQKDEMVAFVDLNDQQLKNLAYVINNRQEGHKKHSKASLVSAFLAMPLMDTIASGVLVKKASIVTKEESANLIKAPLSTRALSAARTATGWTMGLGLIGLYNVAKYKLASKSTGVRKFENNHPLINFAMDMTVITVGLIFTQRGAANLLMKYFRKNPEKAAKYDAKLANIETKLDNSSFNKKTLPKLAEKAMKFTEKMPALAKAGRFALANSIWILLGAGLLHMTAKSNKEHDKVNVIYGKLKEAQIQARERLEE